MKSLSKFFLIIVVAIFSVFAGREVYGDIANPHPVPPSGTVTDNMLVSHTLTNASISDSANISAKKVRLNGVQGAFAISDGTNIATTTTMTYSTTTHILGVQEVNITSRILQANGTSYLIPAAHGSVNTVLTEDGSGNLSWATPPSATLTTNVTPTQQINVGKTVAVASTTNSSVTTFAMDTTQNSFTNFGDSTSPQKHGQSIQESTTKTACGVKVVLKTINSPTDAAWISLQTDNAGVPSGASLATTTIYASALTGSLTSYTLNFDKCVTLTANTKYWIVFERSGSFSDPNTYGLGNDTGAGYANGVDLTMTSGSWGSANSYDITLSLAYSVATAGIYEASGATAQTGDAFIGFAQSTVASTTSGAIIMQGVVTGLSGLTPGLHYYLSDQPGELSSTPGTFSRKVGTALTSTSLIINTNW